MQSIKQQVMALVLDYQAAVYEAVALLNAKSEQDRGFQCRPEVLGVWAGYLDDLRQGHYHFHGIGCRITTPKAEVNFDYACEGGCTGVDPWSLVDFWQSNPAVRASYSLLINEELIEPALQELVSDGVLTQHLYAPDDQRYYLTADIGNPNLPRVTLHLPDEDPEA